jgi:hypothetical protein
MLASPPSRNGVPSGSTVTVWEAQHQGPSIASVAFDERPGLLVGR